MEEEDIEIVDMPPHIRAIVMSLIERVRSENRLDPENTSATNPESSNTENSATDTGGDRAAS